MRRYRPWRACPQKSAGSSSASCAASHEADRSGRVQKMVKWIKSVEFVVNETSVGLGYGGKNEDDEYYDLVPNI